MKFYVLAEYATSVFFLLVYKIPEREIKRMATSKAPQVTPSIIAK